MVIQPKSYKKVQESTSLRPLCIEWWHLWSLSNKPITVDFEEKTEETGEEKVTPKTEEEKKED